MSSNPAADAVQGITETDIPLWAYKQWDKHLANDAAATVAAFEALIGAKHD